MTWGFREPTLGGFHPDRFLEKKLVKFDLARHIFSKGVGFGEKQPPPRKPLGIFLATDRKTRDPVSVGRFRLGRIPESRSRGTFWWVFSYLANG